LNCSARCTDVKYEVQDDKGSIVDDMFQKLYGIDMKEGRKEGGITAQFKDGKFSVTTLVLLLLIAYG